MKTALLTEQTRARAVGQLSDALRTRGYQHADVVQLTQEVYREAGKPVPDLAEVDAWLDERGAAVKFTAKLRIDVEVILEAESQEEAEHTADGISLDADAVTVTLNGSRSALPLEVVGVEVMDVRS